MRILLIIFSLLIVYTISGQGYVLDGMGTRFYQLEGCKKVSDGTACDSCFIMTRGLNGKFSRCLHISELRALLSGGGGGLYGSDTVYLVNNSNGSYTLVNEAGTNYLFGYKFVQSGDTLFLTDQDGTKADTAIITGLGDGNGIYGGSGNVPTGTYAEVLRTETFGIGYLPGFPGTGAESMGLYMDGDLHLINGDSVTGTIVAQELGGTSMQSFVQDGPVTSSVLIQKDKLDLISTDGTNNQSIVMDSDSTLIGSNTIVHIQSPGIVLNDLSGSLTGQEGYVWKSNGYTGYWGLDSLGSSVVTDGLYNDIEVTNNGADWEVRDDSISFNKLRNIASDRLIGRDSTGTGNAHELTVNSTLEFTGTNSIQRAALTGDVTAPAGSNVTTIANDAVTNAKLANMATQTIKGRNTAGTGDPEDLSVATVKTMLGLSTNLLNTSGNVITSTVAGATDTALAVTILNTNLSGNIITTNVNNVTDTTLAVGSHIINYDGNATLTSTVNGVTDTCDISAITGGTTNNIVTNGNIITSTVNGVSDTALSVVTNVLTFSSDDLTSTVNGVASNTIDLSGYLDNTDDQKIDTFTRSNDTIFVSNENDGEAAKFIVLPAVAGTTNNIVTNANIITSTVNGVSDTTVAIRTNDLSSSGNTMTSTVNGVQDDALIVTTITNGVIGNTLTTSVNGVGASTTVILKDSLELSGNIMQLMVNGIYDTSLVIGSNVLSYQDPILTSTINGVTDTAFLQISGNPFDKNGFYSGNGGNGGDGAIPNDTYSQLMYDHNYALGYFPNYPATGDPHDHGIYFDDGVTFFAFDSINEVNTYSKVVDGLISSQIVDANDIDNTTEEFFAIDKWYILCANNTASSTIEMVPDSMVSIAPINKWLGEKVIIDDLSGTGEGNHDDVWVSGGVGNGGYWEAYDELLEEFLQDTLSLSGNVMTMNVNGVTDTSLVIGEVNANLSGNQLTINVNDVTDTSLVVGEVNLNLSGNVLTTNTNDVTDTSLVIGNVTTSYSGGIITTSVNGVSDTALIVSGTIGNLLDGGNTDGQTISYGTNDNFAAEIEVQDTVYQSIGTDGNKTYINKVSSTNTMTDHAVFQINSFNTASTSFGQAILFQGESSTTENRDMARYGVYWTNGSDPNREAAFTWHLGNNAGALAEVMKLDVQGLNTGQLLIGSTNAVGIQNASITTGTAFTIGNSVNQLTLSSSSASSTAINITPTASGGGVTINSTINNLSVPLVTLGTSSVSNSSTSMVNLKFSSGSTPSSGSAGVTAIEIANTINQTGSASGTCYGLRVNPTLTSVLGSYIGVDIPYSNSNGIGINQTGANTINIMRGSTSIGTTTSPTSRLFLGAGTTSASTGPLKFNDGPVMTASEEGAVEYDSSFYFTNEQRIRFGAGGTIKNFYTDSSNVGTGETDLYRYLTDAGTLGRLGESIEGKYAGTFTDATATAQLKVYFAGTLIGDSGTLTVSSTGSWTIDVSIIRTASTTARATVTITAPTTTSAVYTLQTDLTSLNLGSTNQLKISATAGGAGGGNGDITAKMASIKWFPAGIN